MFRYVLITILGLAIAASAEPLLEREDHFFGIPNVDSLSTPWFLAITDSADPGFLDPVDIDVLELSPADYRLVVLDGIGSIFTEFRIDQQNGLNPHRIVRSGEAPDSCSSATAMCQIKHGTYFDPETDRIAVDSCFEVSEPYE
jgi:hypothetical protein